MGTITLVLKVLVKHAYFFKCSPLVLQITTYGSCAVACELVRYAIYDCLSADKCVILANKEYYMAKNVTDP